MILIKDRHPISNPVVPISRSLGKYDTYKGSTPILGSGYAVQVDREI